jgi:glycosyltransferase involved in cell wall biosynthesis
VATSLDISVVVSTYQRPQHLRRCLTSLTSQRGVSDKFEVLVADDGSQDETASMVAEFRKTAPFPLKFYTHPHDGFQLARCRNSGIRASVAPYILFTDGDCIFPPDHLRRHLDAREPGVARAGDCIRIDQATSERIDEEAIRSGRFLM